MHAGYNEGSDTLFRISMITVGIIMLTLLRDLLNTLQILVEANELSQRRHTLLTIGAIAACVGIINVGVFPVRVNVWSDFIHDLSANVTGIIFYIPAITIRCWQSCR
jgi:hypothetical protein